MGNSEGDTTREGRNQLEVRDYGRVKQVNSQSSFRDSLRKFAGGTFWMVVLLRV